MTLARVQGNSKGTSTGNSIAVSLSSAPTDGNMLIAVIGTFAASYATVSSISQTGVTWTQQKTSQAATSNPYYMNSEIWAGVVGSSAAQSLTVNLAANAAYGGIANVCEYSDLSTSSFLDQTASNNDTSGSNPTDTGTTSATQQANELAIGASFSCGGATTQSSPTNDFTLLDGATYGSYTSLGYLEKILSATGTQNSGATASIASWWVGCIAAFKASTGGGTNLEVTGNLTVDGTTSIGGELTSNGTIYNKGYYNLIDTNGSTWINTALVANTSPNTDFHFVPNFSTQSGGTSQVYFGYNSNWGSFNWMNGTDNVMRVTSSGVLTSKYNTLDDGSGNLTLAGTHLITPQANFVFDKHNSTGSFYWRNNNTAGNPSSYNELMRLTNSGDLSIAGNASFVQPVTFQSTSSQDLSPQRIVSGIWNYAWNSTTQMWDWAPLGLPNPSSKITMTSTDTNNRTYTLNLFEIISDAGGSNVEPLLATDVGLVIKKDISAGGFVSTNQGEVWIGHGRDSIIDVPKIVLSHAESAYGNDPLTNQPGFRTLYLRQSRSTDDRIPITPANLDLANITAHGDRVLTIDGYSQINWNTLATQQWDDLGSVRFNRVDNENTFIHGIEVKTTMQEFQNGQETIMLPILDVVYLDPALQGGFQALQEIYPNGSVKIWGDFLYYGSLIPFDSIDDFVALRAIKTKVDKNGQTIHDPDTLKFLQDDKGFFSLGACVGWELSIQQKFLQEIDSLKTEIVDLKSELTILKEK